MDLRTLDMNLLDDELVEDYEDLVWTERYSDYGDFELTIRSNQGNKRLLSVGTLLSHPQSLRVMTVESVEDTFDEEGNALLKIKGRSLEAWLEERVTRFAQEGGTSGLSSWTIDDVPAEVARTMFNVRCRNNVDIPSDNFSFLGTGSPYSPGSIPEPTTVISVLVELETVYSFIKKICNTYNLGFRLVRDPSTFMLYFDVYTGHDRTSQQSTNTVIIFSQSLDNLANPTELQALGTFKNVAYVFAPNGTEIVYSSSFVTSSTAGFERRVMLVDASDVDLPAGQALSDILKARGLEELSKNRAIMAFDGEAIPNNGYVYDVDYALGDLVEVRSITGSATNMRVVEQIFVSDAQGERSYPTFAIDELITPGSWLAWDAAQYWADAQGYWVDA